VGSGHHPHRRRPVARSEDAGEGQEAEGQQQQLESESKGETTPEQVEEARREAVKYRRDLRAAQAAHDETRKELEQLRAENESSQEKAVREAVEAARSEEAQRWAHKLLEAEVAVRAAGKLADPGDAIRLLAVDDLLSEQDEQARAKKVDQALDDLLEAKPYLAANGQTRERSTGGLITQGARSTQAPKAEGSPDDWFRRRAGKR
jgi:hypothetical protein